MIERLLREIQRTVNKWGVTETGNEPSVVLHTPRGANVRGHYVLDAEVMSRDPAVGTRIRRVHVVVIDGGYVDGRGG